jgi:uncharacterized protein YjbJ (UPF0337 family)
MNKDIVKGRWKEIKGMVKQKWGKFTEDDITRMQGTYDELAGSLQKKYGYQKDQAEKELNAFLDENHMGDKDR